MPTKPPGAITYFVAKRDMEPGELIHTGDLEEKVPIFNDGDRVEIKNPKDDSDYEFPQGTVEKWLPWADSYVVRLDEAIATQLDGRNDLTMRRVVVREELLEEPTEWVGLVGVDHDVTVSLMRSALNRLDIPFRVESNVGIFDYMVFVPRDHYPEGSRTLTKYVKTNDKRKRT